MTEKELLLNQPKKLYKLSNLLEKGLISLQELADIIPGILHVNCKKSLGLKFLSKNGCDIIGYSLEELILIGPKVFERHQSDYMLKVTYPNLIKQLSEDDRGKVISFYEDWQHKPKQKPTLYFTTTKVLNDNELIAITLNPNKLESLSKKINNLFGINYVFEKYYHIYSTLTKREKEILGLLGEDLSRKEIGMLLFISEKTVKKHCENIYRKLDTSKRIELEKIARAFSTI
tara:strand:+ start:3760 stop:4452 length:693 start_codon:yes stop_codon:yes gene_type:complete